MAENGEEISIFQFGAGLSSAPLPRKEDLGAKGYHLALMCDLGLPVPPGFIIETDLCRSFFERKALPPELPSRLAVAMADLGKRSGRTFSADDHPLLVSVRSGSVSSMPGMLETILNIGLCDRNVEGLVADSGNPRFAWDSYRRLISSFGSTVRRIPRARFEEVFADEKKRSGAVLNREIDAETYQRMAERSLVIYEAGAGHPFPQDPYRQLAEAVEAVLRSWTGSRAVEYRKHHNISETDGTAVTVQAMVFGNFGYASGTGVAFTRNPATGDRGMYADFLLNAQGEDIVSGGVDPDRGEELERTLPAVHRLLLEYGRMLENHFTDMQDMEFTVQEGKLYLLQTRSGKRTALAALRIAVDMVREGLIGPQQALARLEGIDLAAIRDRRVAAGARPALCRAVPASIGVATGEIALDAARAEERAAAGAAVILVRGEMATEDVAGIESARGILTAAGSRTSHAAVVARQLDRVCLVACEALRIDMEARRCAIAGRQFREGEVITLDGRSGEVYAGAVETLDEPPREYLAEVARWRAAR